MAKKILIIEDDPDQVTLYQLAFQAAGIQIESADGGIHGLAQAKASHSDLILLDIFMEDMNGVDVLRQLKETADTKDIPVIMLSNSGGKEMIEQTKKMGAIDFFEKTRVMPTELVSRCKKVLGIA